MVLRNMRRPFRLLSEGLSIITSSCSKVFLEDYNCHHTPADGDAVDLAETSWSQGQVLFLEPHELFAQATHSKIK